jgi:hypothetical protein
MLKDTKLKMKEVGFAEFLKFGYQSKYYFWEFVVFFRKISIILSISFASYFTDEMQLFLSTYVLWTFWVFQLWIKPYSKLNYLENLNFIVCLIISYSALYFRIPQNSQGIQTLLLILVVVANISFILYWLSVYFKTHPLMLKLNKWIDIFWEKFKIYIIRTDKRMKQKSEKTYSMSTK